MKSLGLNGDYPRQHLPPSAKPMVISPRQHLPPSAKPMVPRFFHCRFIFVVLQLLVSSTLVPADHSQSMLIKVKVPLWGEPLLHEINAYVQPFVCGRLTYQSDTPFERDEFLYLIGFNGGDIVTKDALKKALCYLAKKNKFKTIELHFSPLINGRRDVHFCFHSFWTFSKVTISGVLHGRDTYRYLYALEQGCAFDEQKHRTMLSTIQQHLREQGYMQATVADTLIFDHATKTVAVHLTITRNNRFFVDQVKVVFEPVGSRGISSAERNALQERIQQTFSRRVEGKGYSCDLLNKHGKNLKKMLTKKGFLHARVTLDEHNDERQHKVTLVVTIDLKRKQEFVFFGNHFFSDAQLQEIILSFGQSTLLVPPSLLAQELEHRYKKKGFLNARVEARQENNTCFFIIHEGTRARIDGIELRGIAHFSESVRSHYFSALKKRAFFDADVLKKSLDNLEALYRQEGFLAVTLFHETVPSNRESCAIIRVHVDEGPRYFVQKMNIQHFPHLEHQGPFAAYAASPLPLPFDGQQIQVQRRWLLEYMHNRGYLYAEVKPLITADEQTPTLITITWRIAFEQGITRFGKTVVTGTCPIPFKHVVQQLSYHEGQPWNKAALENSLTRLRDLNLFSTVHVYPENIAQAQASKIILAQLIPDDPFEIRARGGVLGVSKNLTWREGATYKVGGSFLAKNILYSGGQLRFDVDLTRFERYLSLSYDHPWLFDQPYATISKAYANKYTQPVVQGSREQLYIAHQQGFLCGISRKHGQGTAGLNCGLEWMKLSLKNKAAARAIDFAPSLVDVNVPYLYVEPTIVIDNLDNSLDPTRGSLTFASLKGMIPLQKIEEGFIKMLLEQSFFYPLTNSVIGAFRVRFGHIFNRCLNQIMPPERFYLGGAYSVRGYDYDFVPPLGCLDTECGRERLVPQGGKTMFNINLECRFPLFKKISGALFQDGGLLLGDERACIRQRLVAATGFGLRYNTPIGPLRFDVGFKWKKDRPSDSRMSWFLTLGNAF